MISFRLSASEYEQFRDFCATQGASSASELARAAVKRLIKDPNFGDVLESRVNNLEGQLHLLALELKKFKEEALNK